MANKQCSGEPACRGALKLKHRQTVAGTILLGGVFLAVLGLWGSVGGLVLGLALVALEAGLQIAVRRVLVPRGMATLADLPVITPQLVDKFSEHGYDPELGWVRKANTSKIDYGKPYAIDGQGSRVNPGDGDQELLISSYGDSFAFCRECHDHETWQYFLARTTGGRVQNFGVGNYGFDQSLLRLKREYPGNRAKIVIIAVVPQTIARILSVWKHFNEFGNVLAFKPSFFLQNDRLVLRPNYINSLDRFCQLSSFFDKIKEEDFFYAHRFVGESFQFPFIFRAIVNWKRMRLVLWRFLRFAVARLGMRSLTLALDKRIVLAADSEGACQAAWLYENDLAQALFAALVDEFKRFADTEGFSPVVMFLPMRDDLLLIKQTRHFYKNFIARITNGMNVLDLAPEFLAHEDPGLFFHSSHYNVEGNRLVAHSLAAYLQDQFFLEKT